MKHPFYPPKHLRFTLVKPLNFPQALAVRIRL